MKQRTNDSRRSSLGSISSTTLGAIKGQVETGGLYTPVASLD